MQGKSVFLKGTTPISVIFTPYKILTSDFPTIIKCQLCVAIGFASLTLLC